MGKGLQNTVDGLMKIGPVLSETDGLGVQNTAVACGAYQFDNGKKKQLRGVILYIGLIQKIQILLEKRKIILVRLLLEGILKNTPGQILGNETKKIAFCLQPVQNIVNQKVQLCGEVGNMCLLQCIPCLGEKLPCFM